MTIVLIFVAREMNHGMIKTGIAVLVLSVLAAAGWHYLTRTPWLEKKMYRYVVDGYEPEKATQLVEAMDEDDRESFRTVTELLYLALSRGNLQGAELLLKLGMDVNAFLSPESSETTVLQTFCAEPEPDMKAIRFLLEHGANPDAGLAFPPMIDALKWGNEELVQLLLAHGATPGGMDECINPSQDTPLHSLCSARAGDNRELVIKRVKALLEAGADVNALTAAGHTPLDVAMEKKGDEDKPMDKAGILPLHVELIDLLKQHGAKRGCQLRCPAPRFCGRVLVNGTLPAAAQLQALAAVEPVARLEAVNHAWKGEGLGALVDDAAMSDEQKRAVLAHTCYVEVTLQENGSVPLELGQRYMRLMGSLAKMPGCVGVDYGRTVVAAEYAPKLGEEPELAPAILVQGKWLNLGQDTENLVTEGMEDLGFPEVAYMGPQSDNAVGIMQEVVLPMLLIYGTCLEHNHRAFITPDFSLVARMQPFGPGGRPVLALYPDHNNYRE